MPYLNKIPRISDKYKNEIRKHFKQEVDDISEYIYKKLECENLILGNPLRYTINKLLALEYAKEVGLNIPNTCINSSKLNIPNKYLLQNRLITKNISNVLNYIDTENNFTLFQLTNIVDYNDITNYYNYSLFQTFVNKEFEIRSFYLLNKTYSIATFSSNKLQVDIRDSNSLQFDRSVKYLIPEEVEQKIIRLMHKLELNTGSIDLLYSNSKIFFLEVNPVGQFDYVSGYGDYNLERLIAQTLIDGKLS